MRAAALSLVVPAIHRPITTRDDFVATFGYRPTAYAAARAAGFSRAAIDAAVGRGLLTKPRRGILVAVRPDTALDARETHLELLAATIRASGRELAASHESAALVHGIATPGDVIPSSVSLVARGASGRHVADELRRTSPVPPQDLDVVNGLLVTGLARTGVDLARGHRLPAALIPLDSAARRWIAHRTGASGNRLRHLVRTPELRLGAVQALEAALESCRGWAGTVAVRTALPFVDPGSETALESRSRGWFLEAGLPALNPGTPIRVGTSTYWADFCDPELRVIGEADGWGKYGASQSDVRRALQRERRRSDALQEDGWRVVRWTTSDPRQRVVRRMAGVLRDVARTA